MSQSPKKPSGPLDDKERLHANRMVRWAFFLLGFVFLGLGILGVVLPGLPTTVFILLAGYCWAKSSRRFYGYLLGHKIFGKMLRDWEERRAMPRFAKYLAWGMMTVSCAIMFYQLPDDMLWLAVMVSVLCVAVAVWMAKLPDA
ncbi:YbaN family protein [Moraxella nasibovis]|uniref:YbaN family protein n=1 Tax=Moraxella nasibovis TaxID=2904120 RepID=UPI00241069F8|nr:YbaN family protein [Moraxella nasibovis]WFF38815.1 YbaN family protein [Moraxella nasibovis]